MLGPVTQIPESLHREHILLCLGEDPPEFEAALKSAGAPSKCLHAYRGFRCYADDERLIVLGGIGVGSQEPLLWELLRRHVHRVILTGTSGALSGFGGGKQPHFLPTAHAAYSALHAHPKRGFHANLSSRLPTTMAVSTDAFYGFGPAILNGEYPLEPALEASYGLYKDADALVDMETAYFYWAAPRFSQNPDLEYGAIRAAANAVTNFDEMAGRSEDALTLAVAASWAALKA